MKHLTLTPSILPFSTGLLLALGPALSWAIDLGELNVVSGADEPLRAEIPLNARPDELAGASAKLASREIFRHSGLEYRPGLKDLMIFVVRRGERSIVEIRSAGPVSEGDLRFLLELEWPAGRVIREYALKTGSVRAVAPKIDASTHGKTQAAVQRMGEGVAATHVVQSGETLKHIAEQRRYSGVLLEQMLLGLFNANPDAFADRSINRLKTGAILAIPEEATVAAIPEGQAKRFYLSHVGDWNGFRRSLANSAERMPAGEEVATRADAGKIAPQAGASLPQSGLALDQVKVDMLPPGAKDRESNKAAAIADRLAQEKALKDAQERLAELEKNVEDLQRVLRISSADLARSRELAADASAARSMGDRLLQALKDSSLLGLLAGFFGLVLVLIVLFRRKSAPPGEALQNGNAPSIPPPAGGEKVAAHVPEFDMSRISLDLSAKPVDDGKAIWAAGPRREASQGRSELL